MIITRCTISLRGPFGDRAVDGMRCGEWAAYPLPEQPSLWALCLLPTGFSLPLEWASFESSAAACRAMMHIQRLKNSWAMIQQDDLTLALRDRLREICRRYGAVKGPATMRVENIDQPPRVRKRVNGYHLEKR